MTRETDALIAYFKSTGVEGIVTDINTPSVHAKTSYHYHRGTPSELVYALDRFRGQEGQAIDLGLANARPDDPRYFAIFKAFEPVESQLTELIHSGPQVTYFIHNGKRVPIAQLDPALRAQHRNHVHVAVAKGTFLATSPSAPIATPQAKQTVKDDGMADRLVITYPNGTKTVGRSDGAIFNAGTRFYGSMNDLKPEEKLGVTEIVALTPIDPNDDAAGYCAWSQKGDRYSFTPDFWRSRGHAV